MDACPASWTSRSQSEGHRWAAFDDPPSLTREGEHPRNFVNTLDNVMKKSFWEAGHRPTLIAAFLYFDLAFMAWVLLGPLGRSEARRVGKECAITCRSRWCTYP